MPCRAPFFLPPLGQAQEQGELLQLQVGLPLPCTTPCSISFVRLSASVGEGWLEQGACLQGSGCRRVHWKGVVWCGMHSRSAARQGAQLASTFKACAVMHGHDGGTGAGLQACAILGYAPHCLHSAWAPAQPPALHPTPRTPSPAIRPLCAPRTTRCTLWTGCGLPAAAWPRSARQRRRWRRSLPPAEAERRSGAGRACCRPACGPAQHAAAAAPPLSSIPGLYGWCLTHDALLIGVACLPAWPTPQRSALHRILLGVALPAHARAPPAAVHPPMPVKQPPGATQRTHVS